jgi:hypothetical protein
MSIPYDNIFIDNIVESIAGEVLTKEVMDATGVQSINIDRKIEVWSKSKYNFYKAMGNNLKIERDITAAFPSKEVTDMVYKFLDTDLMKKKEYILVQWLLRKLSADEISNNLLSSEQIILGKKFNAGMKISKLMLQLVPGAARTELQVKYSRFLENFSGTRKLVISIDPLDFFQMSENTTGWRSCQSLNGQYKTATLAYLMDRTTMVAYVLTNSGKKCWRQLIYVAPEMNYAVQSRQYPSRNIIYSKEVSNSLVMIFDWEHAKRERVETSMLYGEDIVVDKDGSELWYNDVTRESVETVTALYNSEEEGFKSFIFVNGRLPSIRVGVNAIACICGCGEYLDNAEYLFAPQHFSDRDYDEEENEDE